MRINFVTMAGPDIASFRYHVRIPGTQLKCLGHDVSVSQAPELETDRYIFHKHWNYGDYWYMRGIQAVSGAKAIFHCCDNHFETKHRDHYKRMLEAADRVIVPTEPLRDAIIKNTDVLLEHVIVIPDAFESLPAEPKFRPQGKLKVFWFGHHSNLDALQDIMPIPDIELLICSTPGLKMPMELVGSNFMPWSHENVISGLEWCDVVILPVRLNEEHKLGKSPNRMFESIRRGKFVIASPLPAYEPFKDWMQLGDIKACMEWLKSFDRDLIENLIKQAQEYVNIEHHPHRIGRMWQEALAEAGNGSRHVNWIRKGVKRQNDEAAELGMRA